LSGGVRQRSVDALDLPGSVEISWDNTGPGFFVAKKRVHVTVEGFAQLVDMFAAAGDSMDNPIPVATETPRG
jgi:hypothetical protein